MNTLTEMLSVFSDNLRKGDIDHMEKASRIFNVFNQLYSMKHDSIDLMDLSCQHLYSLMESILEDIEELRRINMHEFLIYVNRESLRDKQMYLNMDMFETAFREIILNAMKFSKPETGISIVLNVDEKKAEISVINETVSHIDEIIGIPHEYENTVFEPFFRLQDKTFDDYKTLDYGLGLTLVKYLLQKFKGEVLLRNIEKQNINSENANDVLIECTISLPIVNYKAKI